MHKNTDKKSWIISSCSGYFSQNLREYGESVLHFPAKQHKNWLFYCFLHALHCSGQNRKSHAIPRKTETAWFFENVSWRRVRDSNPRALADNCISSAARYDHFDNSPACQFKCIFIIPQVCCKSKSFLKIVIFHKIPPFFGCKTIRSVFFEKTLLVS